MSDTWRHVDERHVDTWTTTLTTGQATYAATKAALAAFCHSLRGEVADRGVRVTVAHPGPIATGLGGQTRVIFGATLAQSTCDTKEGGGSGG